MKMMKSELSSDFFEKLSIPFIKRGNLNFLNCIALFLSLAYSTERDQLSVQSSHITFVGTKFNIVQNGDTPNRYIWLHGDEQTARMALEHHVHHYGGIAFFINSNTREIPFESTMIDPNRIFSRKGAYHALRKFKPNWKSGALKRALNRIDSERDIFLDILMPSKNGVLISVHNNFRGYNVNSEKDKTIFSPLLKKLNKKPLISLDLRLGEGSGAAVSLGIIKSALACHSGMASFDSAGVSNKD